MGRIRSLPVLTAPAKEDVFPIVDDSADETKQITLETLLDLIYPVGSIYINAEAGTNPGTLFGFGIWEAHAVGRVLVGINGADSDFDTAEETGGAKTHTLTASEMPVHSHGVNDPGHRHTFSPIQPNSGAGGSARGTQGPGDPYTSTSGTGISIQNAGNGVAHNNLQPYQVAYIWKRTA